MTGDSAAVPRRIAFVCVQNAGRSQMATAFAERERARRGIEKRVEIITGGTRPADRVHDEVVDVMAERDLDISDRTPREVSLEDLMVADYVITMGCSASDVCPATWSGESRDWALDDPHDLERASVRRIRDEIEALVEDLFDELFDHTADVTEPV